MSGGSLDYAYCKINDISDDLASKLYYYRVDKSIIRYRKDLVNHLKALSDLLHEVEWNMSGDKADEDELLAFEKWHTFLGKDAKTVSLELVLKEAEEVRNDINALIKNLKDV